MFQPCFIHYIWRFCSLIVHKLGISGLPVYKSDYFCYNIHKVMVQSKVSHVA